MSRYFETIRRYYRKGLYSDGNIETLRLCGAITAEEAKTAGRSGNAPAFSRAFRQNHIFVEKRKEP